MPRKQTTLWKMRNGDRIRICDMGDQHLLNTMRFLDRWAAAKHRCALGLAYELESLLTGEMAGVSIGDDIDHLETDVDAQDSFLPDIYWKLCDDCARRGLPLPTD